MPDRMHRIQNALWGLFVADALAMPAHWYYNHNNLRQDFDGGVTSYHPPPHPHPESFMVGSDYRPDLASARALGRPFDILHEHARFYDTTYTDLAIRSSERENEHGNAVPGKDERYHYHHGLRAGENTLGAHLVRALLRSVIEKGRYEPDAFLEAFIAHMSTPGKNRDPYTEIYLRRWFENYTRGLPADVCAAKQRDVWSIGAHGGMIRPVVVALLAKDAYQGAGLAVEHQQLTHRSENVGAALHVFLSLIFDLLQGLDMTETLDRHAAKIRLPKVSGRELYTKYKQANGPANIPDREMWRLHTDLEEQPLDLRHLASRPEEEVVLARLATACYPEHGLPLLLYFARRHPHDMEAALLANANAGGDNVHRGMLLGLLMGAVAPEVPRHLLRGLVDHEGLKDEIDAFAALAVSGKGI